MATTTHYNAAPAGFRPATSAKMTTADRVRASLVLCPGKDGAVNAKK